MTDVPDARLLEQFARNGSEDAFAALVQRHIALVHSVALRHTANPHHAQEITQAVCVIFARKARKLSPNVVPTGWRCRMAGWDSRKHSTFNAQRPMHRQSRSRWMFDVKC